MVAFSINGFATNRNNDDKKVKEEFAECCSTRKISGTPGKADYKVFTPIDVRLQTHLKI